MQGNVIKIRNIVNSVVNPSGITKFNVTYIPKLGIYKITLISPESAISGKHLADLINSLQKAGFTVTVKTMHTLIPKRHVIILYAIPSTPSSMPTQTGW